MPNVQTFPEASIVRPLPDHSQVATPNRAPPEPIHARLPEPARSKAAHLIRLRDEAQTLSSAAFDPLMEVQAALATARARLVALTNPHAASMASERLLGPSHPSVLEAKALVTRHEKRLAEVQNTQQERRERRRLLGSLVKGFERYLAQHIGKVRPFEAKAKPKVMAGESVADAIGRVRAERSALLTQLEALRAAPVTKDEAVARMRRQVAALAERGAPDLSQLYRADGRAYWPERTVRAELIAFTQLPDGTQPTVHGGAHFAEVDIVALFGWACRETLEAKLLAEIERQYATDGADAGLTGEERNAREIELLDAILALERDEEALIMEGGDPLNRRPDVDPRALLGLTGPAPTVAA